MSEDHLSEEERLREEVLKTHLLRKAQKNKSSSPTNRPIESLASLLEGPEPVPEKTLDEVMEGPMPPPEFSLQKDSEDSEVPSAQTTEEVHEDPAPSPMHSFEEVPEGPEPPLTRAALALEMDPVSPHSADLLEAVLEGPAPPPQFNLSVRSSPPPPAILVAEEPPTHPPLASVEAEILERQEERVRRKQDYLAKVKAAQEERLKSLEMNPAPAVDIPDPVPVDEQANPLKDLLNRQEERMRRQQAYLAKVAAAKEERSATLELRNLGSGLTREETGGISPSSTDPALKRKNRWDSDSDSEGRKSPARKHPQKLESPIPSLPLNESDFRATIPIKLENETTMFMEPPPPPRSLLPLPGIDQTPTPDNYVKNEDLSTPGGITPMKIEDGEVEESVLDTPADMREFHHITLKLEKDEAIFPIPMVEDPIPNSARSDLDNKGDSDEEASAAFDADSTLFKMEDEEDADMENEEGKAAGNKNAVPTLFVPRAAVARSSKKIPDAVLKRKAAEKRQKLKEEEEAKQEQMKIEEEIRKKEEYERHLEEQKRKEEENQFEPDDIPYESDEELDDGTPRPDIYNPLFYGCRSVEHYERLGRIDEGTYGVVFCARNKRTKEIVALKQVKMNRDAAKEGFPITALRETNVLLSLKHPNIVEVKEMVVGSSMDKVYMVMEYMDHDLKAVMDQMKQPFTLAEVKCLLLQITRGVEYMHRCWYIHRDLKTSNLLYSNSGKLTICDFGLARKYESPIRAYTHMVVTLWYRPPELLLGTKKYSTAVDMWGVGCIFAELITRKPLFPGKGEVDQLTKIFEILGSPNEQRWPGYSELPGAKKLKWKLGPLNKLRSLFPPTTFSGGASLGPAGFDLMNRLLEMDPQKRITAREALEHEFWQEAPLPTPLDEMPKMPSRNDKFIEKALSAQT